MAADFGRFWIDCGEEVEREWLLAEAFELGAGGAEETEAGGRFLACIYVAPAQIEMIRSALREAAPSGVKVRAAEATPEVDWSEAWKEGLEALVVSERLVVRPPFVSARLAPGQREIVIEPGQAFGTGAHASTRLCLEWMDALMFNADVIGSGIAGSGIAGSKTAGSRTADSSTASSKAAGATGTVERGARFDRVLDVGTGSGVLALAAVALGAQSAVGFDLDPVAIEAAEQAARLNRLDERVSFFAGPIESLSADARPYPLVVANLLKREMLPIASPVARSVAPGGRLVLAGLLEEDVDEVVARFAREGLVEIGREAQVDAIGRWVGLCLGRPSAP